MDHRIYHSFSACSNRASERCDIFADGPIFDRMMQQRSKCLLFATRAFLCVRVHVRVISKIISMKDSDAGG